MKINGKEYKFLDEFLEKIGNDNGIDLFRKLYVFGFAYCAENAVFITKDTFEEVGRRVPTSYVTFFDKDFNYHPEGIFEKFEYQDKYYIKEFLPDLPEPSEEDASKNKE